MPPPRANGAPSENYTDVFLSHARLYVFAEQYEIQKLRMLALDNLHNTLKVFHLYKECTGDIISLLRYAYANTNHRVNGEDLRALLTDYMGFEMDTLMEDGGFRDLMIENGGELSGDYMQLVRKRIAIDDR